MKQKTSLADIQILSRITFLDKVLFTKHLAVMIKSGVTLAESLTALLEQTKSAAFKKVLSRVSADIANGQTLAKALRKHPKVFDMFYISLIEIGEESGTLEANLEYLAKQLTKDYDLQNKIKGALMYPMIVFSAAIGLGVYLSLFVLPKLIDLFTSLDVKLPLATRILLFVANAMKNYGILIVIGAGLLLALFRMVINLPSVKHPWQRFIFTLPALGSFLLNVQLVAFCRNFGMMLHSGLPITRALEVQKASTANVVFSRYLDSLQQATAKGKALGEELQSDRYPVIPGIVGKMVAVGEKTGTLDEVCLYLGGFFEEEVDYTAKNFSNSLEPVVLILVGLVVAFIALAVISPIYQITGSISAGR